MNKLPRKLLIAIIIISILFSFINYINSGHNIDELTYVMAIAIDTGTTAKYKITFQLSSLESTSSKILSGGSSSDSKSGGSSDSSSSSSGSSDSSSSKYIINSVETNSIDTAINIANAFTNNPINLSHCKIVIISEDLAKQGITEIINTLINKEELRPDCNLIISQIPVDEFEPDEQPQLEDLISKFYDISSNQESGNAYTEAVEISDFYLNLNDDFFQPYATLGVVSNTKKNADTKESNISLENQSKSLTINSSEPAVKLMGLSVFNNDFLVGTLTSVETLCHLLITNNLEYSIINIPNSTDSNETLDLYLSSFKNAKINVTIINGSPFITAIFDVSAKLLSSNNNTKDEQSLKKIEEITKNYLTTEIYSYLNKTSKEFNSDVSGIGRYATKNFKTLNDWRNYNWKQNYKNSNFKVDVKLSIKSGLIN